MGANVNYRVEVWKKVLEVVEVSALTESDAMSEAEKLPGVIVAHRIVDDDNEEKERA